MQNRYNIIMQTVVWSNHNNYYSFCMPDRCLRPCIKLTERKLFRSPFGRYSITIAGARLPACSKHSTHITFRFTTGILSQTAARYYENILRASLYILDSTSLPIIQLASSHLYRWNHVHSRHTFIYESIQTNNVGVYHLGHDGDLFPKVGGNFRNTLHSHSDALLLYPHLSSVHLPKLPCVCIKTYTCISKYLLVHQHVCMA